MTTFEMKLKSDNAAFFNYGDAASEITRLLRRVADRIENPGHEYGSLNDINGNVVGDWWFDHDEEEEDE